jgi:3-(3-hydroxy-phenyl)propionate hydroxylase
MSEAIEHDVAIVGFGPTGAALANALAGAGLSVCVIDRGIGVLELPRAVHIDGETMRIFQGLGLAADALAVMRPGGGMDWVNPQGQKLLERVGV